MIFIKINKRKKQISAFLLIVFLNQIVTPSIVSASTDSEQQVEFSPSSASSEIVNMYNGALNYSIPLLSIPGAGIGYDISLSYDSDNVKMLNTASCVGFGWNLNIGSISRQVQGVPDDFNGDKIKYKNHVKPYEGTFYDLGSLNNNEFWGIRKKTLGKKDISGGVFLDNYSGLNFMINLPEYQGVKLSFNSKSGVDLSYSIPYKMIAASISVNQFSGFTGVGLSIPKYSSGFSAGYNTLLNPISMPMNTESKSYSGQLGLKALGTGGFSKFIRKHTNEGLLGSINTTITKSKVISTNYNRVSFGLTYDFNKSNDANIDYINYPFPVFKGTEFLPTGKPGNDIFIQSDQGSGGVFMARTKDVKVWAPTTQESNTKNIRFGGELSAKIDVGVSGHLAYNQGTHLGINQSTIVPINNNLLRNQSQFDFVKSNEVHNNANLLNEYNKDKAVRFNLDRNMFNTDFEKWIKMKKSLTSNGDDNFNISLNSKSDYKKHSYVQKHTTSEALKYGRSNKNEYFTNLLNLTESFNKRKDHVAEINVYETNGLIYTYSEPVYNKKRVDAFFSLDFEDNGNLEGVEVNEFEKSLPNGNIKSGLTRNSLTYGKARKRGMYHRGMELLNVTELPEYAVSWPVSLITSQDYEDLTNDGPTNDDVGAWVKFKYHKTHENYKWRTPYSGVSVIDGVKGESGDDMGFYRYGEKEVKYVEEIETKTHIAVFEYDYRLDGYPVKNELEGGIDISAKPLKKLVKVELFLKKNNSSNPNDRLLVQTIHFKYNYSLVIGEPSNKNGSGKLTLESIYSTFYNSNKGQDYKYEFKYGDENNHQENPKYDRANLDRWGDFKWNRNVNGIPIHQNYPFQDFLYTEEGSYIDNAPWCLKQIKLPSGATMNFNYEMRDYAYVEDEKALQMYDIISVENDIEDDEIEIIEKKANRSVSKNDDLTGSYSYENLMNERNIIVKLPNKYFEHTTDETILKDIFYDKFIKGIEDQILIKPYVKLRTSLSLADNEKDYGYLELMSKVHNADKNYFKYRDHLKVIKKNNKYYGVIRLEADVPNFSVTHIVTSLGTNLIQRHPIKIAGINEIKTNRSEIYFGRLGELSGVSPFKISQMLRSFLFGYSNQLITEGYADRIRLNGWSKIRLKNPDGFKKGGGYRIKSVELKDNWKGEDSPESYSYIQKYDYTIEENKVKISSGVANEPMLGREETATYKLYYYQERLPLVEANTRYINGHPLDNFTTSPSIGYRKITVSNDFPENVVKNSVKLSTAPVIEYEFFTAKDFPNIKKHTATSNQFNSRNLAINLPFNSISRSFNAISQGYTLVSNDMAGKLKSIEEKTRNGDVISKQEYEYLMSNDILYKPNYSNNFKSMKDSKTKSIKRLDNELFILHSGIDDEKFKAEKEFLGLDYDIWLDARRNSSELNPRFLTKGKGRGKDLINFNIQLSTKPLWLLGIEPFILLDFKYQKSIDDYYVLNKVINQKGVLAKVKTQKEQSEIESEYLYYDKETAMPLVTKVDNEWHNTQAQVQNKTFNATQPYIYKFSRPAYWEYNYGNQSAFLGVYKSIDKRFAVLKINDATEMQNSGLVDGDVIAYTNGTQTKIAYVVRNNSNNIPTYEIKNRDYTDVSENELQNVRVIRSGNANMVSTTVGELVFKNLTVDSQNKLQMNEVLNASAITFEDEWNDKACCISSTSEILNNNLFINGTRNNWKPYQSFVFHDLRDYSNPSFTQRGLFKTFYPFNWQTGSGTNWVLSNQAQRYNLYGNLIESKNALGLYSSSLIGYGNTQVISVIQNSQIGESAFESFEEINFDNCWNTGNIGLSDEVKNKNQSGTSIINNKAHTGKNSLKIAPNSQFKINRVIQCNK